MCNALHDGRSTLPVLLVGAALALFPSVTKSVLMLAVGFVCSSCSPRSAVGAYAGGTLVVGCSDIRCATAEIELVSASPCGTSEGITATVNGRVLDQVSAGGEEECPPCTGGAICALPLPGLRCCARNLWRISAPPPVSPRVELGDGSGATIVASFNELFFRRTAELRLPAAGYVTNGDTLSVLWSPAGDTVTLQATHPSFTGFVSAASATTPIAMVITGGAAASYDNLELRGNGMASATECTGVAGCTGFFSAVIQAGLVRYQPP